MLTLFPRPPSFLPIVHENGAVDTDFEHDFRSRIYNFLAFWPQGDRIVISASYGSLFSLSHSLSRILRLLILLFGYGRRKLVSCQRKSVKERPLPLRSGVYGTVFLLLLNHSPPFSFAAFFYDGAAAVAVVVVVVKWIIFAC